VYWTNQNILDGAVNAAAWLTRKLSLGVNAFDKRGIDGAVNGTGIFTKLVGAGLRRVQSGNVQSYAALLFAGTVILALGITRSLVGLLIALGLVILVGAWSIFRMTRREESA
jgi:NADH:ubiquinone oxidoreductase subunit 5 (subunit L)/multisubunit Na+/H+ antiporter MnhA subunit